MEGVEEEPKEDSSDSAECMTHEQRRSSVSIDKVMADAKVEDDQVGELPFAISLDAPAVSLPSRASHPFMAKIMLLHLQT